MIDDPGQRMMFAVSGFHWIDTGDMRDVAHLVVGRAPSGDPYRTEYTVCGQDISGETSSTADPLRTCEKCLSRVQLDGLDIANDES